MLWCLQQTHTYITWLLTAICIPLIVTVASLATLFAIHLPLSFMVACAHCKHQRQKSIYAVTTVNQSTDKYQPSSTTWESPHSSVDDEIIPLISDQQPPNQPFSGFGMPSFWFENKLLLVEGGEPNIMKLKSPPQIPFSSTCTVQVICITSSVRL